MTVELSAKTLALLEAHRERCSQRAVQIMRTHGSREAYIRSLVMTTIDRPDDPRLAAFYDLYQAVFPLDEEREPIDGFKTVLALNGDEAAQKGFGPFYEPVLVLTEPNSDVPVAAANLSIYTYAGAHAEHGFQGSCQLHFLLVREDLRGLGIAAELLTAVEAMLGELAARDTGKRDVRTFMTCEQNNPQRMDASQIEADARAALIHPTARMNWWRKRQFRQLDLDYVQPPLNAGQKSCDYLDYYARATNNSSAELSALPSGIVLEHIRRFFFVSVGKLRGDMATDPDWLKIAANLKSRREVALLS